MRYRTHLLDGNSHAAPPIVAWLKRNIAHSCLLPSHILYPSKKRGVPLDSLNVSFVNLAPEFAPPQITAEKEGSTRLAQCQQGGGGGLLDVVPRKAAQNRVGVRRAQAQGGTIFDQVVRLGRDQVPVERASEDRLEVGIGLGVASCGAVEPLFMAGLQPG